MVIRLVALDIYSDSFHVIMHYISGQHYYFTSILHIEKLI